MEPIIGQKRVITTAAQFKAAEDGAEGTVTAYVAVFGNVDLHGDRIVKGAFTRTLGEWSTKGAKIPVVWSHQSNDPDMFLGTVAKAAEDEDGLKVEMQLDLDHPKAARAYRLIKDGAVDQYSFHYAVRKYEVEQVDGGDSVWNLTDLDLFEVGPTLRGANPETRTVEVKEAPPDDGLQVVRLSPSEVSRLKALLAADVVDEPARGGKSQGVTAASRRAAAEAALQAAGFAG